MYNQSMKRSIFNNKIFVFILACLLLLGGFNLPSNKKVAANAQSTVSLSNLVVSVGFKGSTSALQKQTLENTYNLSPNGVKSYFSKVSKGSLNAQAYIPTQSFVELDITEEKFCEVYKIAVMPEFPAAKYDEAVKKLEAAIKAKKGDK